MGEVWFLGLGAKLETRRAEARGPKGREWGWGCSPSGVRSGAPAANGFWTFGRRSHKTHLVVTNFVQFQTTNICYNSAISSRISLFIYAPQHWSGSRTCRTGCYGPAKPSALYRYTIMIGSPQSPVRPCKVRHHTRLDTLYSTSWQEQITIRHDSKNAHIFNPTTMHISDIQCIITTDKLYWN